jgi:hypothetical protein
MTKSSTNQKKLNPTHQELYAIPLQIEEDRVICKQPQSEDGSRDLMGFGSSGSDVKVAINEILDRFCNEISQTLEDKNLKWEAEIELGVDFGFTVKTKIKISPKD